MVDIGLKILTGFNVLIGIFFIALAAWPGSEAKPAVVIVLLLLWGLMFVGLAAALWMRRKFARMWTIILYGLIGFVVLMNLIGEFGNPQSRILQYPLIYGFVYLLWLAFAIAPVVFMLRHDVKEYFSAPNDS